MLQLIAEGRINAVELDLKDEAGVIGWNPPVPLRAAARSAIDDLRPEAAVQQLHAKGVRVIGRLVAFRDPIHAQAAWNAGRRDEVDPDAGRRPVRATTAGSRNFANPAVRQYNIASRSPPPSWAWTTSSTTTSAGRTGRSTR